MAVFVDFAQFSSRIDRVCCALMHSFLVRNWCGISECEQALALDRNLAAAHGWIGLAKIFMGRGEETEAHIRETLRISPRDANAYLWTHYVGIAKFHLGEEGDAVA
jgi:hypothetical protein